MKNLKNTALVLTLIIIIAATLRLPMLDVLPSGITVDEAGQAISANSILKTGKDEWGDFLPLNPRGFGDYKPPVLMYLMVPSIALFGMSEFAVRLPSAISGIFTVLVTYFLIKQLFKNKTLAVLSAFLLAISPWHIYYSRLAWESNIGLLFFITAIWLFLKGLEKPKYFAFSALSFGLAGLSYHSFKLLVPLMVLSLIIIFWSQVKKITKKHLITSVSVIMVFVLILGYGFIFSGASRRASDQSILKEENLNSLRQTQIEDGLPQPLNRVVYNKYQFFVSKVTDNYLGYYSFSFLFGPHRSDGSILNFPSLGLLYIWQLPLLLFGLWYLIKKRDQTAHVLFAWIILAPIPAAITQDYMHAGRAQPLFPALTIVSAVGLYYLFNLLPNKNTRKIFIVLSVLILIPSLLLRINNYLFHTFNYPLGGLKQGYKEVINFTESNKDKYDKFVFTKTNSEPHAFVGFYGKTDPELLQSESTSWKKFETDGLKFLDMTDYKLGKYEFRNIDYSKEQHEKNAIIVASPEELPELVKPKFEIKDDSGKVIFVVLDTNEIIK